MELVQICTFEAPPNAVGSTSASCSSNFELSKLRVGIVVLGCVRVRVRVLLHFVVRVAPLALTLTLLVGCIVHCVSWYLYSNVGVAVMSVSHIVPYRVVSFRFFLYRFASFCTCSYVFFYVIVCKLVFRICLYLKNHSV